MAELRELHDRNVSLSTEAGGLRGWRGRRVRRDARDAESDLLRVLGFPSYDSFVAYVDGPPVPAPRPAVSGATLSLVEPTAPAASAAAALDAEETEAALRRVLNGEPRRSDLARVGDDIGLDESGVDESGVDEELRLHSAPGWLADLHARIAYFEEELAETRFELGRVRDRVRNGSQPDEPDQAEATPAAEALVQAAAELRSLCDLLRVERAELASIAADARAEAQQILDAARREAQLLRDEAATAAWAVLDQASADAIALTRNAISTVDGLRRLAGEDRARPENAS